MAFLIATAFVGVFVTLSTEVLSLFHALTRRGVGMAWSGFAAIAVMTFVYIWFSRPRKTTPAFTQSVSPRNLVTVWLLVCAAGAIAVVTGILGIASAPANYDSMTYHLARVMHWIQNRSVAHFPTNFHPQIYHGPWAEFAILQLQLLSGGDRFAFAVQWLAMIGSVSAVSLIALKIGADVRGQALAAIFAVTLPAGILQAVSTQNNYVPAYWLLCLIVAVLGLQQEMLRRWIGWSFLGGAALGLALLTKGTAYLLVIPFLAWLAFVAFRGGKGGRKFLVIGTLALALNWGHYVRNFRCGGSPLLPRSVASNYRVDAMSPSLWASNVFRHVTLQLCPPGEERAKWMQSHILNLYRRLGMNPDDHRITAGMPFRMMPFATHEDLASNPAHLLLILCTMGILATQYVKRHVPAENESPAAETRLGSAGLQLTLALLAFVALCAGIKWMPYNGRLELPVFVLAAAPVGTVLSKLKPRGFSVAITWCLLFLSIRCVLGNHVHTIFGSASILKHSREEQYFVNGPTLLRPYQQAANFLANEAPNGLIGLAADGDQWEYPWWPMLKRRTGHLPVILPVYPEVVPPGTHLVKTADFDAIIVVSPTQLERLTSLPGVDWRIETFDTVTILLPRVKSRAVTDII